MPAKQRKYRANAPIHIRQKLVSGTLSKELRKKHEKKSFPLKKGDKVKVMKGQFKGRTGKIERVDLKKLKATVEGVNRVKKEGAKIEVLLDPSNLQIIELSMTDKKRQKAIERKQEKKFKKLPQEENKDVLKKK